MPLPWNLQKKEDQLIGSFGGQTRAVSIEFDVPEDDVLPHFKNLRNRAKASVGQIHSVRAPVNWLSPYIPPPSQQGEGSCFVVNFRGTNIIITNDHCVRDSAPGGISVSFPVTGSRKFPVRWIASSPERDMAIFRLSNKDAAEIDLVPLEIGDSDKVKAGHWLVSMGFPLGQPHLKSSKGVFSGIEWVEGEWRGQVDYALNHGNSGGCAINSQGQVVGINNAIIESAQNIGYIILSNDLSRFMADFEHVWDRATPDEKKRTIHVPKLIVAMKVEPMDPSLMRYLNSDTPTGMYIASVIENSMFSDKIKQDDQIVSINNRDVDEYGQVHVGWTDELMSMDQALDRVRFGDTVSFGIIRNGTKLNEEVVFEPEDPRNIGPKYTPFDMPQGIVFAGMVMQTLNLNHIQLLAPHQPSLMRYTNIVDQCGDSRVIVTSIIPNTVAATKPIQPGMIIKNYNDQPVTGMNSFIKLAEAGKQRQFTIIEMEDMSRIVFETNTDIPRAAAAAAEMTMNNPMIDVLKPVSFSRINCEHFVGYCNCADRGKEALSQLRKMFKDKVDIRCEHEAKLIAGEVFPVAAVLQAQATPQPPVRLEDVREMDEVDYNALKDLLPTDMLEEMMLMGDVTLF